MVTLETAALVCTPSHTDRHWVKYSTYGYMVKDDGTVYALTHYATHGLVLALLYPEVYEPWYTDALVTPPPDRTSGSIPETLYPEDMDSVNKYFYQDFEFAKGGSLPCIRISGYRVLGYPSVDRGSSPATEAQLESVRAIFATCGFGQQTRIETNRREMPIKQMWEFLTSDNSDPYAIKVSDEEYDDDDCEDPGPERGDMHDDF